MPVLLLSLGLLACGPEVAVEILSPVRGPAYFAGQEVLLDALVTADGVAVGPTPTWRAPDWERSANLIRVTDLPLGTYVIEVEAEWERGVGSAEVEITVEEPPPEPIVHVGTTDIQIDITSPYYTGTVPCAHQSLELTLHPDGTVAGEGRCDAVGERLIWFEGAVSGAEFTGTMRLDGQEEALDFVGARGEGTLTASFDGTFTSGQGSMRLYGSFTATAAP